MSSLFLLFLALPAHALQSRTSGPLVEVGLGGGYTHPRGAGSAHASLGWWVGRYDDEYALGRFTAVLATPRVDLTADGAAFTGLMEVRRSIDLFVLAPHALLAAGPVLRDDQVGLALRAGGGLKFRRTPHLGFVARLEAGADLLGGRVVPVAVATVGVGWSAPRRSAR